MRKREVRIGAGSSGAAAPTDREGQHNREKALYQAEEHEGQGEANAVRSFRRGNEAYPRGDTSRCWGLIVQGVRRG